MSARRSGRPSNALSRSGVAASSWGELVWLAWSLGGPDFARFLLYETRPRTRSGTRRVSSRTQPFGVPSHQAEDRRLP